MKYLKTYENFYPDPSPQNPLKYTVIKIGNEWGVFPTNISLPPKKNQCLFSSTSYSEASEEARRKDENG